MLLSVQITTILSRDVDSQSKTEDCYKTKMASHGLNSLTSDPIRVTIGGV